MFCKFFRLSLIFVFIMLATSCKGRGKGCIDKEEGSQFLFGSTSSGSVTLKKNNGFGNWLATLVIKQITSSMYGSAKFFDETDNSGIGKQRYELKFRDSMIYKTFTGFTNLPQTRMIVSLGVIIVIIFWGLGMILGTKELKLKDITTDLFRLMVVVTLTSESGWTFYYTFIIKPILLGSYYFGEQFAKSIDPTAYPTPFAGIDRMLSFILSLATIEKVIALLLSGPTGAFTAIALFYALVSFSIANLRGMVLFGSNLMIGGFLLCLGPVFIILLLFERTKDFFKNWFGAVVSCGLQQMTMFMALVIINHVSTGMVVAVLYYDVCWSNVFGLRIYIPVPGFLKGILKLFQINLEYFLNIRVPFFNFFVAFQSPEYMMRALPKIGGLVFMSFFSNIAIQVASDIGIKLSEFGIAASDSGVAKAASDALNKAQNSAGTFASSMVSSQFNSQISRAFDPFTGQNRKQNLQDQHDTAKQIKDLEGKAGFVNAMKSKLLQAKLAGLKAQNFANTVGNAPAIMGSLNFGLGLSKKPFRDAKEHNKKIFGEIISDDALSNLITLKNSNKIDEYNETYQKLQEQFVKQMTDTGGLVIEKGGNSRFSPKAVAINRAMTTTEAQDWFEYFVKKDDKNSQSRSKDNGNPIVRPKGAASKDPMSKANKLQEEDINDSQSVVGGGEDKSDDTDNISVMDDGKSKRQLLKTQSAGKKQQDNQDKLSVVGGQKQDKNQNPILNDGDDDEDGLEPFKNQSDFEADFEGVGSDIFSDIDDLKKNNKQ